MLDSLVRVTRRVEHNHFADVLKARGRSPLSESPWIRTLRVDVRPPVIGEGGSPPPGGGALWTPDRRRAPGTGDLTEGPGGPTHLLPNLLRAWQTGPTSTGWRSSSAEADALLPETRDGMRPSRVKGRIAWAPWMTSERILVVLASLLTISSTFDLFFKVLFTFPSLYFFAIGFPPDV